MKMDESVRELRLDRGDLDSGMVEKDETWRLTISATSSMGSLILRVSKGPQVECYIGSTMPTDENTRVVDPTMQ